MQQTFRWWLLVMYLWLVVDMAHTASIFNVYFTDIVKNTIKGMDTKLHSIHYIKAYKKRQTPPSCWIPFYQTSNSFWDSRVGMALKDTLSSGNDNIPEKILKLILSSIVDPLALFHILNSSLSTLVLLRDQLLDPFCSIFLSFIYLTNYLKPKLNCLWMTLVW
jgi:hypothetical protein